MGGDQRKEEELVVISLSPNFPLVSIILLKNEMMVLIIIKKGYVHSLL